MVATSNVASATGARPFFWLPWTLGDQKTVTQGNGGGHSGIEAYAWDFGTEGWTVRAARGGEVVAMDESQTASKCAPSPANYVRIKHVDGSETLYAHLAYNSVSVAVGDKIPAHTAVGTAGHTGHVCPAGSGGGHLHYQVQDPCSPGPFCQSLASSFQDANVLAQRSDGVPVAGDTVTSQNHPPGTTTPGVIRQVSGQLQWNLRNANSGGPASLSFTYGLATDAGIAGDWDGEADVTAGVTRAPALWNLRNSNSGGLADLVFSYGTTGDTFLAGDWDATGSSTPAIVRPVSGQWQWHLRNSNDSGAADITPFTFGLATDTPIVGDWDGDGSFTPGVIRAPNTWYLRNSNTGGAADIVFGYGTTGDTFVTGDWDGNGTTTPGVVRIVAGQPFWYLRDANSSGPATIASFAYGLGTDTPLVGDWDGL